GSMNGQRTAAAGSALSQEGQLLVGGGTNGVNTLSTSELFNFATITTDAADYPPGTSVNITGSGWQPGETVSLTLLESPYYDTHGPYTAVADSNGRISNSDFAPDEEDLNIRFYLTARGSVSQAQATFTDGNATSVTGKVTDFSTGRPISGATVACDTTGGCNGTFSTTTDASGNYSFPQANKLGFAGNGP